MDHQEIGLGMDDRFYRIVIVDPVEWMMDGECQVNKIILLFLQIKDGECLVNHRLQLCLQIKDGECLVNLRLQLFLQVKDGMLHQTNRKFKINSQVNTVHLM